jgi:hypothetical protein
MSIERAIRHVPKNMGKMLVCGNGHNQRPGSPFIGGHEFDVGGQFEGIVPPEFLPGELSIRNSRWKIPADAPIYQIDDDMCVACRKPPFHFFGGPDIRSAWPWLEDYAPALLSEIHTQISRHPGASLEDWPALINDDLKRRVRERLDKSLLDVEHSIPKAIGDEMWHLLIAPERRVLQVTLLVRGCRDCNLKKSKRLLPREQIEQWYIDTYFDGDRAGAKADARRWTAIDRVLTKIYEYKALG